MKKFKNVVKTGACASIALVMSAMCACSSPAELPFVCEHNNMTVVNETAPDCTANGVKQLKCTDCDYTKTELVPALGHDLPKDGVITYESTCTEHGIKSFECSVCGDTVTYELPLNDHDYAVSEVTTAPSSYTSGVKTYTCSVCEGTMTEKIDPVNHADADIDGTCDICGDNVGSKTYSLGDTVPLVDGPWTNPEGFSWWSYGLTKDCSEDLFTVTTDTDTVHTENGKSIKINFTDGAKATPENPNGEYLIHIGMPNLMQKANYTLTFYAKASEDFTGNLNKMLNNENFGKGNSIEAVMYDKVYDAENIAGKDWMPVSVTFNANPSREHSSMSCFRIAFDIGTDGWQGELYLADFEVKLTDILRKEQGLPPLNEPTRPVNTVPVLDEKPDGHVELPDEISEGGVWLPGPLTFGEGTVSIDDNIEYVKGGKSILFNTNKALHTNVESGFIIPIKSLEEGKRYQLKFYAQGSEHYNGALTAIMANPNYTFVIRDDDGNVVEEIKTMLDVIVDATVLTRKGEMQGRDWTECTVTFTANPRDGLCSLRVQMMQLEGFVGQLWLSGFVIAEAPPEPEGDEPQVKEPVADTLGEGHVALPNTLPEGQPWLPGPQYTGDSVFAIDENVEYAVGARSLSIDMNKAIVGVESALFLSFDDLEQDKNYVLEFYAQGSANYNGAFDRIFANPNYDTSGVTTMLDMKLDAQPVMTVGGLIDKGWQKISVAFKANPKDGKCSIRMQFRKQQDWEGTIWLSYFVIVEGEADPAPDAPQITEPVEDEIGAGHVALPDSLSAVGAWTAGPGFTDDAPAYIDSNVEYATGAKSIAINVNKATVNKETAILLAFDGLEKDKEYTIEFYVQGSANYNGAFKNIMVNGSYDTDGVKTMYDLTVDGNDALTAGGLTEPGWKKVTVKFKAEPKDGKCSLRIEFQKQDGWEGTVWMSYFVVTEVQGEVDPIDPDKEPIQPTEPDAGEVR